MKIPLFLMVVVVLTASQFCPPPELLHPCICEFHITVVYFRCTGIHEKFNLKELFDNVTEAVNTDYPFYSLDISGLLWLTEIEDGWLEHLKFQNIHITNNANLTYISPLAFGATKNYTRFLSLRSNNIRNDPPYDRDVYDLVNGFAVDTLPISSNTLSSIPDNAFQKNVFLINLYIYENRISHIGSRAFASLQAPYLSYIYLDYNLLPSEGLPEDAFEGIPSDRVRITLYCNEPLKYLEQRSYQTMLELAGYVYLSTDSGSCSDGQDPYYECDERSDWICDREDKYRPKLLGFVCRPETGLMDIWDYCDSKNTTFNNTLSKEN